MSTNSNYSGPGRIVRDPMLGICCSGYAVNIGRTDGALCVENYDCETDKTDLK